MGDTPPRSWAALAGETTKRLPVLLLIAGVLFLVIAVTTGLGTSKYTLSAQSETWRAVSACAGSLLILAGIVVHWQEARVTSVSMPETLNKPGPYTETRNFPIKLEELVIDDGTVIKAREIANPENRVKVKRNGQKVTVKVSGKELDKKYNYELMLMHTAPTSVTPRFRAVDRVEVRRGQTIWQTQVRLPDLDTVNKNEEWRLAFYYVGPNGRRLVAHHGTVCEYFAPGGKPKSWPPIDNPPRDEFVQCSDVLLLRFGSEIYQA